MRNVQNLNTENIFFFNGMSYRKPKCDEIEGYFRLDCIFFDLLKEFDNQSVCFLFLQKIFSGEFSFCLLSNDEELKHYSFKNCYETFIKALGKDKKICFDTLSPQFLPVCKSSEMVTHKKRKYGTFYHTPPDAKSDFCDIHWEYRLDTKKYKPYNLSNLKEIPAMENCSYELNDVGNGSDYLNLKNVFPGFLFLEKVCCDFEHLKENRKNISKKKDKDNRDDKACYNGNRINSSFVLPLKDRAGLSVIQNSDTERMEYSEHKILHIVSGRYVFPTTENVSVTFEGKLLEHSYDSRFSVYFDELNNILKECGNMYGAYSYFFYIFLRSHGIYIKNKKNYIKCELCHKEFNNNINFDDDLFISNNHVYEKINIDILFKMFYEYEIGFLNKTKSIFSFLSKIYISKADVYNFKTYIENCSIDDELIKLRNNIFNYSKRSIPIPEFKTSIDVIRYMVNDIDLEDKNGLLYCRAVLRIVFGSDPVIDVYRDMFSNEFSNSSSKNHHIVQSIHRKILRYFEKNLK